MTTKKAPGGARPGAGRKKNPNAKVQIAPRIKPDSRARLKKLAKKNKASEPEILETLIDGAPDVIEVRRGVVEAQA